MKKSKRELTTLEKEFIKQKESEGYKIIVQDNKLIVKHPYGKNISIANCHPNDQFDIEIGFQVAMHKRQIDKLYFYNDIHRKKINELEKEHRCIIEGINNEIRKKKKQANKIKHEIHELTKDKK